MAKIKTPTHLTFWDFNDTSQNIWFSTLRLIKQANNCPTYGKEHVAVKSPAERPSLSQLSSRVATSEKAPVALFSFCGVGCDSKKKKKKIESRQTTRVTSHPSGKNALMILSPRGLMASSGILWKSSRLQTGGEMIKI